MPRVKSGRRTPNELRASQRWERDPLAARVMRDLAVRAMYAQEVLAYRGSRMAAGQIGTRFARRRAASAKAARCGPAAPVSTPPARRRSSHCATPARGGRPASVGRVGQVASKVYACGLARAIGDCC